MENRDHGRRSIRNGSIDRVLARSSASRRNDEDEEALKWAALEKLPTCDRLRTTIWKNYEGGRLIQQQIDVRQMSPIHRKILIDNLIKATEEDNETFLKKLRHRIDRVGIQLPTIEVRFENLTVNAKCYVGSRATPTLWNAMRNVIENMLNGLGIPTAKRRAITILKDVSGIIKPGRMTLLLGPPSSGKTTLLLALAGKLDQEGIKLEGKITYNGYELHEFVPPKTSAYISQHDLHTGEMTVRETLEFSARCQGVGTRYELLSEISKREKQAGIFPDAAIDMYMKAAAMEAVQSSIITDYTMKILGLDICSDILIGDEMRRGISGGQKKRVTTGEMIVGPTKTLFMDEISTGLDSSTTYQIVKCLQQFVHVLEGTILMSLLQPAPEVFELFDDIILLSDGQIVYHGPCENVIEFFEDCGFVCPGRESTADFLQEVISKRDQEKYWHNRWKPYRYVSAAEFCQRFKHVKEGKKLAAEISQPYDKKKSHAAALVFERYSVDNWTLFKIGFAREWLLLKRNSFLYIFRGMQIFIVAFAAITVFLRTRMYQRNIADAALYMGALFFSIVMIMFNGFAELPLTLARLPVFFKQRDLLFYPAWVFTLPTFVLGLLIALLESGTWSLLTYYAEGFSPEPSRFFKYFLVLFLVHIMASSLFRLIASIFRTMEIASTAGSFILLVIFTLGGFVISKGKIPRWWIWGYWISPLTYAENAISVNEFLAPRWIQVMDQTGPLGIEVLQTRGVVPREYWYWIGIGALFGFIILFNVVLTWALASLKPLGSVQAVMSKETLAKSEEGKQDTDYIRFRALPSKEGNKLDGTALQISGGGAHKQGLILPFTPLTISFDDICYCVDMPVAMKEQGVHATKLKLLSDISGAFRPGILTSLMGVSGAGKTTLMDVLAGRKTTGYIEGHINILGFPKKQETFARVSGYCEQNDVHSPQLTVYESLVFSSWLRLPEEIEHDRKMQFVMEVIELVELESLRDAIIGIPGLTGLSTEQRKRLTIAVELVANPSIIFMDEPTSGLDARAAAIVMRTVRNTVDTGRTVVCTIHQPSIDIFESSDELLLLKRGGQMIYSGELGRHSHKLIEYFEAIPGVPKIREGINPATWMLDVTSESSEQRLGINFSDIYKESPQYRWAKQMVKDLGIPTPGSKDLYFPTRYALSTYHQFQACLWKQYWTYWRSPNYNGVRFFFTLFSAFLFGSIFWNAGKTRSTQQDLFNVIGAAYASTMFLGINNCASVQPVVSTERAVFYRERAAGMYAALPYGLAQVIIEVPYIFIQTILYASITYSMISFEWKAEKFFWYCFTMFFTFMYFTYYGMMAVSLTPNYNVAAIMASSFYALFNLFAGFIIPRPRIPKWWIWYYWICPVAWTIYGLIVSQYGDVTDLLQIPGAQSIPIKDFVRSFFGYDRAFLGAVAAVLVGFTLFFSFIFIICIKCLNFQQR